MEDTSIEEWSVVIVKERPEQELNEESSKGDFTMQRFKVTMIIGLDLEHSIIDDELRDIITHELQDKRLKVKYIWIDRLRPQTGFDNIKLEE